MIHPAHLRRVIREALAALGPRYASEAAVELLMLTAAKESQLGRYLYQLSGGPAIGIFQMEPLTLHDVWVRAGINAKATIAGRYAREPSSAVGMLLELFEERLASDLWLAAAMARIYYWLAPAPLPAADDVDGLANYWHRWWCRGCRGTAAQAAAAYRKLAKPEEREL